MRMRGQEDGGAVAILFVVITTTVLMAAAALAIDAGHYWQVKRRLVTATDAAALAAAQVHGTGEVANGCPAEASTYLASNAAAATLVDCGWTKTGPTAGYVTVAATENVPFSFGSLIGVSNATARSRSTAQVGPPTTLSGLRPLAICMKDDAFQSWLAGDPGPFTVPIDVASACGGAAGNWGWLELDGPGQPAIADVIADGYQGELAVGSQVDGFPGFATGQGNSPSADELRLLEDQDFFVVLYDSPPDGCGGTTKYRISGFAAVRLLGFDLESGSPSDGGSDTEPEPSDPPAKGKDKDKDTSPPCGGEAQASGSLTIDFLRMHGTGACCGSDPAASTVRVSRICDVSIDGPDPAACTSTN